MSNSKQIKTGLLQLAKQAMYDIKKMKPPVIQICGPISTGGFGNIEDNINCLASVIEECQKNNLSVFNQLDYEPRLDMILKDYAEYDYPILEYFYLPILSSHAINGLVILPLWHTSIGTTWELNFAKNNNIPFIYLENILVEHILQFEKTLH